MPSAAVSVRISGNFKCFYFCVDMFNHNPLPRKLFIVSLLLFGQFMILAPLNGYQAVGMKFFNAEITQVRLHRYRFVNIFPDSVFIQLEIMDAAFCLPDINDRFSFPFYNNLGLYRVAFFLPE